MKTMTLFTAPTLAACAAIAALAFGPSAVAQAPGMCSDTGSATVCEGPGSSSVTALPQDGSTGVDGANDQNGAYGPAGDTPPVGRGR